MTDTYLKSKNLASLESLNAFVVNRIDPVQGHKAVPESIDDDGFVVPAIPAAGDPEYWYTCVRAPFPVPAFGDVMSCTEEEGVAVCGVWA